MTPRLACFFLAAMSMVGANGPSLALSRVVSDSGGKALIHVVLTTAGEHIAALQFDIEYPTQGLSASISAAYGATSASKQVWTAPRGVGAVRIVIAGQNQTSISDGPVATVLIQMKPGAAGGEYPVLVTAISASETDGSSIAVASTGGAVIVPGAGTEAPVVQSAANAASWAAGAVAPGEIVVVGGDFLASDRLQGAEITPDGFMGTILDETRVLFDGIAAPLLYTTAKQVSAIVPYAVERLTETSVQVEHRGVRSAPIALPVLGAAPGIFTLDGTGTGQGAILNEDGALNDPARPAAIGSIAVIYATGEGQTSPSGVDGRIVLPEELCRPAAPVAVSIGGQTAEVLYAGSAGYQVAGVFQVNARIPAAVAPGDRVPIVIDVGGIKSQSGVTIAVR